MRSAETGKILQFPGKLDDSAQFDSDVVRTVRMALRNYSQGGGGGKGCGRNFVRTITWNGAVPIALDWQLMELGEHCVAVTPGGKLIAGGKI